MSGRAEHRLAGPDRCPQSPDPAHRTSPSAQRPDPAPRLQSVTCTSAALEHNLLGSEHGRCRNDGRFRPHLHRIRAHRTKNEWSFERRFHVAGRNESASDRVDVDRNVAFTYVSPLHNSALSENTILSSLPSASVLTINAGIWVGHQQGSHCANRTEGCVGSIQNDPRGLNSKRRIRHRMAFPSSKIRSPSRLHLDDGPPCQNPHRGQIPRSPV